MADWLDDRFLQELAQVILADGLTVLRRQDQAVDTDGTAVLIEAHRDLRFAIRPQELSQRRIMAYPVQAAYQSLGQVDRQGHIIRRLIGRIAVHDSLIAAADDAVPFGLSHALLYIRRLLMDVSKDQARIGRKAQGRVGIADIGNDFPGQGRHIDGGRRGDFTSQGQDIAGNKGFDSHVRGRILRQVGVDDGVGNLVTNLIGMAFGHGFRCQIRVMAVSHVISS